MIRQLGRSEWELLRDVRLDCLAEAPAAFASTYEREATFDEETWRERAATSAWFVATRDDEVVGIVAGRRDPSSPPGQRHLNAMWVAPSVRGSGIAAELVGAVHDWAAADGGTEITLGVTAGNARAIAFYRKCGFAATGEHFLLNNDPDRPVAIYGSAVGRRGRTGQQPSP